jgi:phosphoribosylaminoimidazole-succinocarboxamide synthase
MNMNIKSLFESDLGETKLIARGKVRDVYEVEGENGEKQILFIATDRISAFDSLMADPVEEKGLILNQLSKFWLEKTDHIIANHFITDDLSQYPKNLAQFSDQLNQRSMLVKKCKPLPVEFVVRGYVAGSGWAEYQRTGAICGVELPVGLKKYQKLENPIFTPATKASDGHDENITYEQMVEILGENISEKLRQASILLYNFGHDFLEPKGILLADTKFEFGEEENGNLILIDEIMTPDSSRFWKKESYEAGSNPENFDKQILRDYLESVGWDKKPPPPAIPDEIIQRTKNKYLEIQKIIST